MNIAAIQEALREDGLDAWLFYDFRGSDPIALKVLGLAGPSPGTRRWFYCIPASGEPAGLVHEIESGVLDSLPGSRECYLSWRSLEEGLAKILGGARRVAMQYSPNSHIPTVSRVDGGTLELVRDMVPEVVSSADLVQSFEAALDPLQVESHRRAAELLRKLVDEVFHHIAMEIRAGRPVTEFSLKGLALGRLGELGLVAGEHAPILAAGAHAADPHYEVSEASAAPVREGDLLLFDVWAKEASPGSVYADITWCGYVGDSPPEGMVRVFEVVRGAREAAVALCDGAFRSGAPLRGFEVDRAARGAIEAAGYGQYFIHRTGHSIHEETHGNGANMDDLETHDTRVIIPWTLFSVEPGVYLPGRFGIRSEVNVLHAGDHAEVTGPSYQTELVPILTRY